MPKPTGHDKSCDCPECTANRAAAALGRIGGRAKSPAKTAAARANASKRWKKEKS